jgi:hypothetical protein
MQKNILIILICLLGITFLGYFVYSQTNKIVSAKTAENITNEIKHSEETRVNVSGHETQPTIKTEQEKIAEKNEFSKEARREIECLIYDVSADMEFMEKQGVDLSNIKARFPGITKKWPQQEGCEN